MGVLNLLLDTDTSRNQLDLIETGKRSADSLLTVINDVLDFSKIEAGELDLEFLNFNLRSAIAEVVELPAMHAHDSIQRGRHYLVSHQDAYIVQAAFKQFIDKYGGSGRCRFESDAQEHDLGVLILFSHFEHVER